MADPVDATHPGAASAAIVSGMAGNTITAADYDLDTGVLTLRLVDQNGAPSDIEVSDYYGLHRVAVDKVAR